MKQVIMGVVVAWLAVDAVSAAERATKLYGSDPKHLLAAFSKQNTIRVIVSVRVDGWNPADNRFPEKAVLQEAKLHDAKMRVLQAHPHARRAPGSSEFKYLPLFILEVDEHALRGLVRDDNVVSIEAPAPGRRAVQESTIIVNSRAANQRGFKGSGALIAIVDDGVDSSHVFFSSRVDGGGQACFAARCPNGSNRMEGYPAGEPCGPQCWHGTMVAGVAAGSRPSRDRYGVAPEAWITSIQIYTQCGEGCYDPDAVTTQHEFLLEALNWIYEHRYWNFAAVNVSSVFGPGYATQSACYDFFYSIDSAIAALWSVGIPVVAAAGNSGTGVHYAPACNRMTYAVGATYDDDTFAVHYSSAPTNLSFLAPGGKGNNGEALVRQGIDSSVPGGWWESYGTSLAAPHVSGAFAILRSATSWSVPLASLADALKNTGKPVVVTPGAPSVSRINVDAAVRVFVP